MACGELEGHLWLCEGTPSGVTAADVAGVHAETGGVKEGKETATTVKRVLGEEEVLGPEDGKVMIIVKVDLKVEDTGGARKCSNNSVATEMGGERGDHAWRLQLQICVVQQASSKDIAHGTA